MQHQERARIPLLPQNRPFAWETGKFKAHLLVSVNQGHWLDLEFTHKQTGAYLCTEIREQERVHAPPCMYLSVSIHSFPFLPQFHLGLDVSLQTVC